MTADPSPRSGPTHRGRARLRIPLVAATLMSTYLFASFVLSLGTDLRPYSSGIFDMDVARVVSDLATDSPPLRASVHPLQKLLVAPLGRAFDAVFFPGENPLGAARVLIALFMTLHSLGAGWLAFQITGGSRTAASAAAAVCAFSFSTWLAASIPESAAVASLGTLAPLLFLNARWQRAFPIWEALAWGAIAALATGLTLTQGIHCAIALAVRATLGRPAAASGSPRASLRIAAALAAAAVLFGAGFAAQRALYPSAPTRAHENPLAVELHFLRTDALLARPFAHAGRVLAHFAVFDFVAPFPGYSDFLIEKYDLHYWSLSIEEAERAKWTPPQLALAAVTLLVVLAAVAGLRRAGPRVVAPAACVGSQLVLHLFYGREYVLYSPHWHAAWVALLVAGAWAAFPRRKRAMAIFAAVFSLALLANDIAVMNRTYREVQAGLSVTGRHADGTLRAD